MRPVLVAWLARYGLPAWLAPNYFILAGLSSLVGCIIALRLARRDGADVHIEARALAFGYVAALIGGDVFEALRAVPTAIALGSLGPVLTAGRAAYGGLLASILAATLYLRRRRAPVGAFFDRTCIGAGVIFALVRTGCFLEGCDFGRVTALPWGVRFPAGSHAAVDHAQRGWVPPGAPSLPVHPTQLYEALVGALAAVVAWRVLRRGVRDGRAYLTWVAVYAVGRFGVEFLRGDVERGLYAGLSTSQYVSLALLAAVALLVLGRRVRPAGLARLAAALALFACLLAPRPAHAQSAADGDEAARQQVSGPDAGAPPAQQPTYPPQYPPQGGYPQQPAPQYPPQGAYPQQPQYPPQYPPPQNAYPQQGYPQPSPYPPQYPPQGGYGPGGAAAPQPSSTPTAPGASARPPETPDARARPVGFRAAFFGAFAFGRSDVPDGFGLEIDTVARLRAGRGARIELGLELRALRNPIATHLALAPVIGFVVEGRAAEWVTNLAPTHTWINFDSPFYGDTNAWGLRFETGLQFRLGSDVLFGLTPIAFTVINSTTVQTIYMYEPRLWVGLAL